MEFLEKPGKGANIGVRIISLIGRLIVAVGIPLVAFIVLYLGFIFLRDSEAPRGVIAVVAIIWGVGGIALLFWVFNGIVERLPDDWTSRLQPFVFVGPAIAILCWYLAVPTVRTFYLSLFGRDGSEFVGLDNYYFLKFILPWNWFSEGAANDLMFQALRNNFLWIIIGSTLTVAFGLIIAVLADRSKFERLSKTFIFLPMAISFVGASIIWNFIYEYRPAGTPQIGLLNAVVTGLGGAPQAWSHLINTSPLILGATVDNLFLIVIVIWLQAGYSMVLFSAALKGIPAELLEAGRVDGANEFQIFFRIMIPYIMGTIITVWTTVVIFTLKIFDVVWVMTGGQFGTHVIATQFYRQSFTNRNSGYGSAIAIVLLIAVIPVMFYNLRQFREQEAF
jgi:alpha-glucoside transport system permease protein